MSENGVSRRGLFAGAGLAAGATVLASPLRRSLLGVAEACWAGEHECAADPTVQKCFDDAQAAARNAYHNCAQVPGFEQRGTHSYYGTPGSEGMVGGCAMAAEFLRAEMTKDCPSNYSCCDFFSSCCGGQCTVTSNDPYNCGRCGNVCPAGTSCVDGTCCTPCAGQCVNLQTDNNNCGSCGHSCVAPSTCVNGHCVCSGGCNPPCPSGQTCDMSTCACVTIA